MVKPQLKKDGQGNPNHIRFFVFLLLVVMGMVFYNSDQPDDDFNLRNVNPKKTSIEKESLASDQTPQSAANAPTTENETLKDVSPSKSEAISDGATTESNCDWRPEPLLGPCEALHPTNASQAFKTATDCELGCCAMEECFSFQYRSLEGCLFGMKDVRLGAEKDGPTAWCEPRAPAAWQGQWIKKNGQPIEGACSTTGEANLDELTGQCFGLGSRKSIAENTTEACQQACCADETCVIWQWRTDAGCFYNRKANFCNAGVSPDKLEAFYGKRKVLPGRSYTPYAYSKDFADLAGSEFKQ